MDARAFVIRNEDGAQGFIGRFRQRLCGALYAEQVALPERRLPNQVGSDMEVNLERLKLHNALLAQGYARVAVEKLTTAGDIDLNAPGVPALLEQTLRAATNSTNWTALGQRFALLRSMKDHHFDNLFLRANHKRLNLVVVTRFGTAPLETAWVAGAMDYAWPIVSNLTGLLEKFSLPTPVKDAGHDIVNGYLAATDPLTQAAASLLNAALVADVVDAGPLAAFIAICEAGVSNEAAQAADAWKLFRKRAAVSLYPPYMAGFLWDVTTGAIHGHDEMGGGTLSPTQLKASIAGQ
ncbi:MAG: hypothetical protein ACJ74U_07620 [Jatrophihabitantaceae bacterium]